MNFTYSLDGVRNPQMRTVLTDLANDLGDAIDNVNVTLAAAVSGDLIYSVTPATLTTKIAAQNVGTAQVMTATMAGLVAADGAGDIIVTVTSAGMPNSPKAVTVTLTNDDDAATIAGKIQTELAADDDIQAVSNHWTVTDSTTNVIFTRQVEAANDETFDMAITLPETGDAGFADGNDIEVTVVETTAGVAPYSRDVTVKLVDTAGNTHTWYTDNIAMTLDDTATGDAALSGTDKDGATVTGDDNYGMINGVCTVKITCTGIWENDNTNTLAVTEKTILGATVTAKTSLETSET